MGKIIYRKAVWDGSAILLMFAFPLLSLATEHVNPNCCNYPANPNGIKIHVFLESCAVPGESARGMIPYFDCQSYVLGVIDTRRQLNPLIPDSEKICLPTNITTKDVLELIWKQYPNWDIPESRQASEVILEVLQKEFSCKKKK
jgi:hypothetical protein